MHRTPLSSGAQDARVLRSDKVVKKIKPFCLRNHYGLSVRSEDFAGQHVVFCCITFGALRRDLARVNKLAGLVSRLGSRNARVVVIIQAGFVVNQELSERLDGVIEVLFDPDDSVSRMFRGISGHDPVESPAVFWILGPAGDLVKWFNSDDFEGALEGLTSYFSARRLIGDCVPDAPLQQMQYGTSLTFGSGQWFAEKRVVVCGVPGAFTPICNREHLPGYIAAAAEMCATGVDHVVCIAVNDAYVMDAWARAIKISDKLSMLADGSGCFTRGMGLTLDLRGSGLGMRSRRYAMYVERGVIIHMNVETGFDVRVSDAASMLRLLKA